MNNFLKNIEENLENNLTKVKSNLISVNAKNDFDKIYENVRERKIVSNKYNFSKEEKSLYTEIIKEFLANIEKDEKE